MKYLLLSLLSIQTLCLCRSLYQSTQSGVVEPPRIIFMRLRLRNTESKNNLALPAETRHRVGAWPALDDDCWRTAYETAAVATAIQDEGEIL
jgi:hypothetical protein